MALPHQKTNLSKIRAAEVREFVYCPRAWIYRRRNTKPRLSQAEIDAVEERLENGRQFHREHGEAVCLAARQRRWSFNWWYCGLAAAGLAILLLFSR